MDEYGRYNAICSRCGAGLMHVYEFDGRPVGGDCFERLCGIPVDVLARSGFVSNDGHIDLDGYRRSQALRDAEYAKAKADAAQKAARVSAANSWLVDALTPYGTWNRDNALNFFASIVDELRSGAALASELPERAKRIIADRLAKEVAIRGRKREAEYERLLAAIEETTI